MRHRRPAGAPYSRETPTAELSPSRCAIHRFPTAVALRVLPRERGAVATTTTLVMPMVTGTAARTTAGAMVGAVAYGGVGIAAGAAARSLLAGLRRGTRVRAPICELATAALWAVIGGLWGAGRLPSAWVPALLGLAWLGVAAGLVDVRHRRLPDTLTTPAACIAPLILLPLGPVAAGRGLLGALVAVVGYGLVHLLWPAALGLGDVKLAAPLGAVLGAGSWAALAIAAVGAAVLTGAAGLLLVWAGRAPPGAVVPHGPSMLAAAWLVTLATAAGGG